MLLSTSSRFGTDTTENLLNFMTNLESSQKQSALKNDLTKLAQERDRLKRRASILTDEINSKSKTPKPLSEINTETKVRTLSRKMEIEMEMDVQKLELYKFALGVHISERSSSNITFDFYPNEDGIVSSDVYRVTLIKDESGIALGSAILPDLKSLEPKLYDFKSLNKSKKIIDKSDHQMVIPIQSIAAKYLPKIDQFIKTFKNCLDAYLSRFNQLYKITSRELYSEEELHGIHYSQDLTKIQFDLNIGQPMDDGSEHVLRIALSYEPDESKPKRSGINFKVIGAKQFDSELLNLLGNQCDEFSKYPIHVAIRNAFLEE